MKQSSYHFIGIGGIGMSGLARILLAKGVDVSGSDLMASPMLQALQLEGAKVYVGHSSENIKPDCKVVYTTGLKNDNPEYSAAKQLGCTLLHRSDLLAELTSCHETIAVAGMHGKTTTSALMATVLKEAGLDPSFAIGGILAGLNTNAQHGSGKHFVIEACESDGTFIKYRPSSAIVTNIDLEHMDYFLTEKRLLDSFAEFFNHVSKPDQIFWCGDDERLRKIAKRGSSYGFSEKCDWKISKFESQGRNIIFDLTHDDTCYKSILLAALGKHNALNGAAVFALAISLGIPEVDIRCAFNIFQGVARRCEVKGHHGSITCLDDYAHHPIEIKTTLEGIREAFGERRLIVVYQPHRYTRAKNYCLGKYATVFNVADEVIVTEIYSAGEEMIPGINNEVLVDDIKRSSSVSVAFVPRSSVVNALTGRLQENDLLLTLGAGNITSLGSELLKHLKEYSET